MFFLQLFAFLFDRLTPHNAAGHTPAAARVGYSSSTGRLSPRTQFPSSGSPLSNYSIELLCPPRRWWPRLKRQESPGLHSGTCEPAAREAASLPSAAPPPLRHRTGAP